MKKHDTAADAAAIKELRERGTKIFDIMAAMGPGWSYRRVQKACKWLKRESSPEMEATPPPSAPPKAKKSRPTPDEIRHRAASDELTVPFSNWLGRGWYREAGEPVDVYETDDDGEQHLVAMRVDPGILWPDWWDGPKDSTGLRFSAPPARPARARYLLTSMQNATPLHGPAWINLGALAMHYSAYTVIGPLIYGKGLFERKSKEVLEVAPWSADAEPCVMREEFEIAPGLVFAADMNSSATATNPLTGFNSYIGATTTIFPHPKRAIESVPRGKFDPPVTMWSTGSITVPNYILKKAGLKALRMHTIGAVLVEIDFDGKVFMRNIDCDPATGELWDLDVHVERGHVRAAAEVRAERGLRGPVLALGCIHRDHLDPEAARAVWGYGGNPSDDVPLIDAVKASAQVFNDVLNSTAISHHDLKDPWVMYEKKQAGKDDMRAELQQVADFIVETSRPWCETHIVYSNHDDHYAQWLKTGDWRADPKNARLLLESNLAALEALEEGRRFNIFEWALRKLRPDAHFTLSTCDDRLCFFRAHYQYHGDRGPNGGRGSTAGLAKLGIPIMKAHDHMLTWRDHVISLGKLLWGAEYAIGATSWATAAGLEHPDGSRQAFLIVGDKYRA